MREEERQQHSLGPIRNLALDFFSVTNKEGKIDRAAVVVAGFKGGVHGFDTSEMEILAWPGQLLLLGISGTAQ